MSSELTQKVGYQDVFTQKEYCKIILANLISRFGDSIDAIAFTWLVYEVTKSASLSAIVFALNQLPTILVQPFAGPVVENMSKKAIMVFTDICRGLMIVCLAILYYFGDLQTWYLFAFTLIISSVEAFRIPAGMAVIPKLIEPKYYSYANSLNTTLCKIFELIGLGASGIIIASFGIHVAFYIDAITFFMSGVILTFLNVTEERNKESKMNVKSYFENLRAGFVYLKDQPVIRNFCIMGIVINAVVVPLNSLQGPLVSEVLGQGSDLLSIFGIALTAGMGIGSVLYPKISEKIPARKLIAVSGVVVGASMYSYTLGRFFNTGVWAIVALTIVASFTLGTATSMITSSLSVQFMKAVKTDYLARVGAIFNAFSVASIPVTSVIISIVAVRFSTAQIIMTCGGLCVILFLIVELIKLQLE